MQETTEYHVEIEGVFHESPGGDPVNRAVILSGDFDTVQAAREAIADAIPVSLDSGEPMHYDHGSNDEYNIGRVYHYWDERVRGADLWTDAWVTVEQITRRRVKYPDIVPDASTEYE